ncbi:MAG: hypothetical protein GXP62_15680 [Oligoflexia bacterium]|nr:hypothetical protein [Oligoflexia bacterium]
MPSSTCRFSLFSAARASRAPRALALLALSLWARTAVAQGLEWPQPAGPATEALALRASVGWSANLIPAFRAAQRDRSSLALSAVWTPQPLLSLWATGAALQETAPTGQRWRGLDALRLGTRVRPIRQPQAPLDVSVAWRATLPVGFDAGALGTDETDIAFVGEVGRAFGPLRFDGTAGLAILGNPLRFANQDDVPLVRLSAQWDPDWLSTRLSVGGQVHTPRNPDRLDASLSVETPCPLLAGARASAGLSPAAPDWSVHAWFGWAWSCQPSSGD